MNERIKELLEQASEYAHENRAGDWEVGPAYQDIFHKKFAQLIVQDCLAQVARVDDMLEDDPAQTAAVAWVASTIADHFGVEE